MGGRLSVGRLRSCCHYGGCHVRLRSLASLLGALGPIAVPCPFCRAGAEAVLGGGLPESGWRPGGDPLPEPRQAAPCTPPGGRKGGASRLSGPNHGQRQEGPTVSSAGCARPRDHPGSTPEARRTWDRSQQCGSGPRRTPGPFPRPHPTPGRRSRWGSTYQSRDRKAERLPGEEQRPSAQGCSQPGTGGA